MSIDVPPAPSQDAAAPIFAQLADLARRSPDQNAISRGGRLRKALLVVSFVLVAVGTLFHACAFSVVLAPHSEWARFVLFVGKTLVEEVRI